MESGDAAPPTGAACAYKVWLNQPTANGATWNPATRQCLAHIGQTAQVEDAVTANCLFHPSPTSNPKYEQHLIKELSDKTYDSASCDAACYTDQYCVEYHLLDGKCKLYRAGCAHVPTIVRPGDASAELCYLASPNVKPSLLGNTCTHKPEYNTDAFRRQECVQASAGADSVSACATLAESCVYRPWQPAFTTFPTDTNPKTSCACTARLETYTCTFTADKAEDASATRKRLADQANQEACAELVFQTEPEADGVTYVTSGADAGQCFAITGQTSDVDNVGSSNCALARVPAAEG
jgi:hypothetical protein